MKLKFSLQKLFLTVILILNFPQIYNKSLARDLGVLPTSSSYNGDLATYISVKTIISNKLSSCFTTDKRQPDIKISQGESIILPFLDYLCIFDKDKVLLVMEDWVGVNGIKDFSKNAEVFRIGDQIHLKNTDPNTQIALPRKVVRNFEAKYPRVPRHKFRLEQRQLAFNPSMRTVADAQSERDTLSAYASMEPNRKKVKRIDFKKKLVFYRDRPYGGNEISSKFSQVNNLTYNPKPGFENNQFKVQKLGDKKFNISLSGIKSDKPFIDFAWIMRQDMNTLDTHLRFKGLELQSVCNNELNNYVQYKQCVMRQYISGNSTCDFNNIIDLKGTVKCTSVGSFGNKWDSYLQPFDKNLISGIVAAMVVEDNRFQNIIK